MTILHDLERALKEVRMELSNYDVDTVDRHPLWAAELKLQSVIMSLQKYKSKTRSAL